MKDDAILINSISEYVYQTIIVTLDSHPQWLSEKYRKYPWQSIAFKGKFTAKLGAKLSETQNRDAMVTKLLTLLQSFLSPTFFVSDQFTELMGNIRKYTHPGLEIEAKHYPFWYSRIHQPDAAFAILLLDAENLPLDSNLEKILGEICTCPIKIKLAFGNWRRLGKKDVDFHSRGYELIHVPAGKNNADLKMSSLGSSIWINYPTAKEVLICSSDGDLHHLSTALQNHGLNVYRISRQGSELLVFNSQTGKTEIYSLVSKPIIPSLDDFIAQLKQIIQEEQTKTKTIWIKLAKLDQLFQEKYKLTLTQVLAHHFPEQKNADAFLNLKQDFVVHQLSDNSHVYITLFDILLPQETPPKKTPTSPKKQVINLNSKSDLETALVNIVRSLTAEYKKEYVPIGYVATEFQKEYAVAITKTMRRLELGSKFLKLLQSYHQLKITKSGTNYFVGIIDSYMRNNEIVD